MGHNLSAKDYELIASVLADSDLSEERGLDLALDFADRLCVTSDSFDPVRFVNACDPSFQVEAIVVKEYSHTLRLRVEALAARRRKP